MTTAKRLLAAETRAAEVIVRVLEEAGIDMVFGIAGGGFVVSLLTAFVGAVILLWVLRLIAPSRA